MCPFFAIFCNVVESSCWHDLKLLEDVTEGLEIFADFNASVGDLRKLCQTLVSLCQTLQQDRNFDGLAAPQ